MKTIEPGDRMVSITNRLAVLKVLSIAPSGMVSISMGGRTSEVYIRYLQQNYEPAKEQDDE